MTGIFLPIEKESFNMIKSKEVQKVKEIVITFFTKLTKNPIIFYLFLATILTGVIEAFSKRSLFGGFITLFSNPLMFLYNVLIIMIFYSLASFFKKKYFFLILMTVVWLSLGITNFILLGFRVTPLTGNDIEILRSVIGIIQIYLSTSELIFISALLILAIIFVAFCFVKLPKSKPVFKNALFTFCCTVILLLGTSKLAIASGALSTDFGNLADAYQDYGFTYCFTTSIIDRGIEKPKSYSKAAVEAALDDIQDAPDQIFDNITPPSPDAEPIIAEVVEDILFPDSTISDPNIIVIQLESFFDVNYLKEAKFSEDPIPNFTALKEKFSSGFLRVPSIGAGTANTEFEVLSGMSLSYFGAGEYPYKTVLKETAIEGMPFNLDAYGYHSHAMHNNTATFYSRYKVYPHLGFDSFSSIEYMNDVTYNPLNWARDYVLLPEILKAFDVTDTQDFVFAVSVQPHGKYPEHIIDDNQFIDMEVDLSEEDIIGYEYFINQLRDVDDFIGDLVATLDSYDEPTVLVLYGDHLPSLDINNSDIENADIFQTEYVMYSNFPMENIYKDLEAYQLSSYILGRLGFDEGLLTKYHQINFSDETYQENLHLLQYDMLYGEKNVYDGTSPYKAKNMTMGSGVIEIYDAVEEGSVYFIKGKNFTPWSQVYADSKSITSYFIDSETLIVPTQSLDIYKNFHIAQVTTKDKVLSISNAWKKEQ